MKVTHTVGALFAAVSVTLSLAAAAEPRAGAPLPGFSARDLTGSQHNLRELQGRPTLVLAISGPDAGQGAERWLHAAQSRFPPGALRVVTLVALRLPFYATDGMVRGQARLRAPENRWRDTWLDRGGDLQAALGLPDESAVPWAYVLDASGRVVAGVHAPVSHPYAEHIWTALGGGLTAQR